jgi:hypothetical protein
MERLMRASIPAIFQDMPSVADLMTSGQMKVDGI